MAEEKLLTVREVSHLLNLPEKEVIDLAENGTIPAYKVGGVYLRFKQHQLEEFKKKNKAQAQKNKEYHTADRLSDFFYFNDFYILSFILVLILLFIIFKT
jgi:excisionase family DNA binding protein